MPDEIKQFRDMTPAERRACLAKIHLDNFNREVDANNAAAMAAAQKRIDNAKEKAK
jgi:predicted Fe-S protein YdhL (DUF1289 family)